MTTMASTYTGPFRAYGHGLQRLKPKPAPALLTEAEARRLVAAHGSSMVKKCFEALFNEPLRGRPVGFAELYFQVWRKEPLEPPSRPAVISAALWLFDKRVLEIAGDLASNWRTARLRTIEASSDD